MTTPNIPHLSNFRRGGRDRTRGRGDSSGIRDKLDERPSDGERKAAQDKVVQNTDNDASVSRLSAVQAGYLNDPYAHTLTTGDASRRYPIINRGTYVRTTAIDRLVTLFLRSTAPPARKQIISLGAGSDTRFFRLVGENTGLVYHEVDFASKTHTKIGSIRGSPLLQSLIRGGSNQTTSIDSASTGLHSSNYHIHPMDLRDLPHLPRDTISNIDSSLPTLIISECCLCYLPPNDAAAVLKHLANSLFPSSTPLAFVLYEPIHPFDAFGRTMVSNLATRGIVLQTLHKYSSLAAQKERLRVHGFDAGQGAADVDFIWENWIDSEEKERVSRAEILDEVEEWRMLARHYCVAWGWRYGDDAVSDHQAAGESKPWSWDGWRDVPSQPGNEGDD